MHILQRGCFCKAKALVYTAVFYVFLCDDNWSVCVFFYSVAVWGLLDILGTESEYAV